MNTRHKDQNYINWCDIQETEYLEQLQDKNPNRYEGYLDMFSKYSISSMVKNKYNSRLNKSNK